MGKRIAELKPPGRCVSRVMGHASRPAERGPPGSLGALAGWIPALWRNTGRHHWRTTTARSFRLCRRCPRRARECLGALPHRGEPRCRAQDAASAGSRQCRYPGGVGQGAHRDGLVLHERKRPFFDGTTQFLFEPLDFLARLTTLVRRRRTQLVRPSDDGEPKADLGLPAKDDRSGSIPAGSAVSEPW